MPSHTAEPEVEVGLEIGRENCGKMREYVGEIASVGNDGMQ